MSERNLFQKCKNRTIKNSNLDQCIKCIYIGGIHKNSLIRLSVISDALLYSNAIFFLNSDFIIGVKHQLTRNLSDELSSW